MAENHIEKEVKACVNTFFAEKECSKAYKAEYWVPDTTFDGFISESKLNEEYKELIEEQRKEFLEEYPDKANDTKAWVEWMDNYDWGVDEENVEHDIDGAIAQLCHVDFSHPIKVYEFKAEYFVHREDLTGSMIFTVALTDEEYKQLLVDYIVNHEMTVDDIKTKHPETYQKISQAASTHGTDYKITFTELKDDAMAVMNIIKSNN